MSSRRKPHLTFWTSCLHALPSYIDSSFNVTKHLWNYVHPVFLSSVPFCTGTDSLVLQNPLQSPSKGALAPFRRAGIQECGTFFFLLLFFPQVSILTSKHYYSYDAVKLQLSSCYRKLGWNVSICLKLSVGMSVWMNSHDLDSMLRNW